MRFSQYETRTAEMIQILTNQQQVNRDDINFHQSATISGTHLQIEMINEMKLSCIALFSKQLGYSAYHERQQFRENCVT